jgi:GMP synthase (glutamine-hydrolysing)
MRFRLLQARRAGDPVRGEERDVFAARLGVSIADMLPHDLLSEPLDVDALIHGVDAILVGGAGEFGINDEVPWMRGFIDAMGGIADRGFPMFASCFGFQALVVAFGGRVQTDEARAEVGTFELELLDAAIDDPLFAGLPRQFLVQLGHKDHAVIWPSGLTLLARSARCPYQAARVGDLPVYATQFHPELTFRDNLHRLQRYRAHYTKAFGTEGYLEVERGFAESPLGTTPLERFGALISARA